MITQLTVTDITFMSEVRICVACVKENGESIRPKFEQKIIRRDWCFHKGKVIQPFSMILLDLECPDPQPPHTEDWFIDNDYKEVIGIINPNQRHEFLEHLLDTNVRAIFGAEIQHPGTGGYCIRSGEGNRSLGTIRATRVHNFSHRLYQNGNQENWDYRISFTDDHGEEFRLKIVDLTFQSFVNYLRTHENLECEEIEQRVNVRFAQTRNYFRIGLARGWANHRDSCYLQITGVYTFPDYLDGRCFADF